MNHILSRLVVGALCALAYDAGATAAEAQSCVQPISSTVITAGRAAGTVSFTVNDPNQCGWQVDDRGEDWASPRTFSGRGNQPVTIALLNNSQRPRVVLVRAGSTFATIIQAGAIQSSCSYQFVPPVQVVTGISNTVRANTTASCRELAEVATVDEADEDEDTDWITLTGGQSQAGSHDITFNALTNPLPRPRAGAIQIGNTFATVIQAAGAPVCTTSVSPTSLLLPYSGGTRSVSVSTLPGCPWNATESLAWVSLNQSGTGTVTVTVEANTNTTQRTGVVTVAGRAVTTTQEPPPPVDCVYSATASASTAPAGGGSFTVSVTTNRSACAWTTSNVSAGLRPSPTSGSGSRTITVAVDPNLLPTSRTLALVVSGQNFSRQVSVTQGPQTCSYSVTPPASPVSAAVTTVSARVTTNVAFCTWSVTNVSSGLVVAPTTGSGTTSIAIEVPANSSSLARSLSLTVRGGSQTLPSSFLQSGVPCNYQLSPTSVDVPRNGASRTISVTTAAADCQRAPESNALWVRVTSGAGAGSGVIGLDIDPNPRLKPRSASLTVASGAVVPVTQHGAPSMGIDFTGRNEPTPVVFRPAGGNWFHSEANSVVQFGLAGDVPLAADFDGDGRLDRVVFRNGAWIIMPSSGVCPPRTAHVGGNASGLFCARDFGIAGDIPLRMDADGDGVDDFAVFRRGENVLYVGAPTGVCPSYMQLLGATGDGLPVCQRQWGLDGDQPIVADFDGDRRSDFAVFRPSNGTWYFLTTTGNCPATGRCAQQWGLAGDIAVVGHFDRAPGAEIAVYRPSNGTWYLPSPSGACPALFQFSGLVHDGLTSCVRQFGLANEDRPIVQDYDSDGLDDVAVVRSNFWWHVLPSTQTPPSDFSFAFPMGDGWPAFAKQYGLPGDIPISGRH